MQIISLSWTNCNLNRTVASQICTSLCDFILLNRAIINFSVSFQAGLVSFQAGLVNFIASLLCREGEQVIKSKAGVIKGCKGIKITALSNEWRNIPFRLYVFPNIKLTKRFQSKNNLRLRAFFEGML